MTTATVSALVVARNEENRIETCIASAACADEIVVLLDRSEDATGDIARRMGARVVEGDWEDEGARRTAGISACTGDWILELDADERISRALAGELRTLTESDAADYYVIPFHNHFGGKWIRYGWGAYNGVAAKSCLFRRDSKKWLGGSIHPRIDLSGRRGDATGHIDHFVDDDIADMFRRLDWYCSSAARDAVARGETPRRLSTGRRFFSRFIRSYWSRKGYREGWQGMALALFSALYPVLTHLKILELREKARSNR